MSSNDRDKGRIILIVTVILFIYYTLWVIGLPFIDDDRIRSLFLPHDFALIVPAISGFCFIGGLVIYTVYNVRPYLSCKKPEKLH